MDFTSHSGIARVHNDEHIEDHAAWRYAERAQVNTIEKINAVTPTAAGAGWYHDAAIERAVSDAVETRCNPYR